MVKAKKEVGAKSIKSASVPRTTRTIKTVKTQPNLTKSEAIHNIYEEEIGNNGDLHFHKINRPQKPKFVLAEKHKKIIIIFLAIAVVFGVIIGLSRRSKNTVSNIPASLEKWYAVKLVDNEVFYGKINDVSADPVVIKNVYYNYDQLQNGTSTEMNMTGNIRLVKRGKEAHGGEGSLNIVRAQVLYMEPLKDDSKILRAIVEYEK